MIWFHLSVHLQLLYIYNNQMTRQNVTTGSLCFNGILHLDEMTMCSNFYIITESSLFNHLANYRFCSCFQLIWPFHVYLQHFSIPMRLTNLICLHNFVTLLAVYSVWGKFNWCSFIYLLSQHKPEKKEYFVISNLKSFFYSLNEFSNLS